MWVVIPLSLEPVVRLFRPDRAVGRISGVVTLIGNVGSWDRFRSGRSRDVTPIPHEIHLLASRIRAVNPSPHTMAATLRTRR